MLLRSMASPFQTWSFFRLEQDGGEGGSGSGGDGAGGEGGSGGEKTYTEAEYKAGIEAAIKKRVAKAQRDLKVKEKEAGDLQTRVTDLENQLAEVNEALEKAKGEPDEKHKGELELLTKRFEREIDSLRENLDVEKEARKQAEEKQKVTQRDNILIAALKDVGCKDMTAGERYFKPQLEWDDVENDWMFRTNTGNVVTIQEGVEEELPTYLRPPKMEGGGSGTGPGSPGRKSEKRQELEVAEKELKAAKKAAFANRGDNAAVTKVTQLRRKVEKLKSELNS